MIYFTGFIYNISSDSNIQLRLELGEGQLRLQFRSNRSLKINFFFLYKFQNLKVYSSSLDCL